MIKELTSTDTEIIYQISDWFIPENDKIPYDMEEEPREYTINIYGKNKDGVSICTKVVGFNPYFYVKPPETWETLSDKEFKLKVQNLQTKLLEDSYDAKFKTKITKKLIIGKNYKNHLCKLEIERKKDFWGFTNNKEFRYIKIVVKSLKLFNDLKYYFQDNKEGFVLYESNIEPFLKFIHIQNIKPCSWIKVNKYSLENAADTRSDYNISANWSDIIPIDNNSIAPFIVASFDIECSSSHGDFPVAIKNYKKLAQDLCLLAKMNLDDKNLISNIIKAFNEEVIITPIYSINRLYSKTPLTKNHISRLQEREMDIRYILNKFKSLQTVDDEIEEDEEDNKAIKMSVKEANEIEEALNSRLCEILPELEGDKIIQIGTTIHKYGSDEIIYKSLISLNDCDDFEGTTVISCKTEKELLLKWKNEIIKINPDIIIGYNIWGFDMEYIWKRAIENDVEKKFARGLGKTIDRDVKLIEQQLSSSALGDNILKMFDMDGIVIIDLLKVMQRDQKLDSYKLDNVASIFIGSKKDDLKPNEIFEKFKGNSADRCVIAKYCIQDCILVNKLLHKLKIVENNSGMGNVCLVPLNYLFKRGQGIKIYSLITNECMKKGYAIPTKKYVINDIDGDGYEGAIVLEPKEGIYLDEPIVVFDYGSLYPSSMISRNLSHDTYIIDEKYMKIDDPNVEFISVNYDLYEGTGDKKRKVGIKECKFAKYKDGKKGIIPEILTMLLDERKKTRNKIEHKTIIKIDGTEIIGNINDENDEEITVGHKHKIKRTEIKEIKETYNKFEKDIFDALQAAYKVTANSLYGQIGAKTSPIYLKDIAACTTATGREMIMMAKEYVETNYNADVIYGDSVMPYTPLTYKIDDIVKITTFNKIGINDDDNNDDNHWKDYREFKSDEKDRYNKEQYIPDNNMKVWTNKGWAKVRRIIRHRTIKKIYRILTATGLIDVTEDHSLLDNNEVIIKPSKCKIGQLLLHSKPDIDNYEIKEIEGFDETALEGKIKDIQNQEQAQEYFIILEQLGYNATIDYNDNNYIITYTRKQIKETGIIKKEILYDNYKGYVYDIETEFGVFHGGIGHLILKNTDSIFCKFPLKDEEGELIFGKSSLPVAIKVGKSVAQNIASIMPHPQKLNYEKCLYPFILFSKKRYVGNLYEMDDKSFYQKSMGIVLKRRDNANIVKKIYGGIIDIILNKQDIDESIKFLREELTDLINGKTDFKDLIISKTLKSSYKDPEKIAHKVLADRIGIRDAGNKPASNDRIAYIYIKNPSAKLQGDKIETPEFIKDNGLEPDYLHYITNQIMKPVLQLYALCLSDLNDYKEAPDYWDKIEEELKLKTMYQDPIKRKNRLDNLKLMKVQELLFDEFIYKLKEPKKVRETKTKAKKEEKKEEPKEKKETKKKDDKKEEKKEEKKEDNEEMKGEIRIINDKKLEGIKYTIKIMKKDKIIYKEDNNNEVIKSIKKDQILDEILIKLHDKYKKENENYKISMKINYIDYIRKFNLMLAKFEDFKIRAKDWDRDAGKHNNIEMVKLHREFNNKIDLLSIKDNIKIIE